MKWGRFLSLIYSLIKILATVLTIVSALTQIGSSIDADVTTQSKADAALQEETYHPNHTEHRTYVPDAKRKPQAAATG